MMKDMKVYKPKKYLTNDEKGNVKKFRREIVVAKGRKLLLFCKIDDIFIMSRIRNGSYSCEHLVC